MQGVRFGANHTHQPAQPRTCELMCTRIPRTRNTSHAPQFGYFCRGLEAECAQRGIQIGNDSEAMIRVADALPEDKLRSMCQVQVAMTTWEQ